jgi:cystathionine beta-lyase family protein involved in aluminum resistance
MKTDCLLLEAEKALIPIFSKIDAQVKQNLKKVLTASIFLALVAMDMMI